MPLNFNNFASAHLVCEFANFGIVLNTYVFNTHLKEKICISRGSVGYTHISKGAWPLEIAYLDNQGQGKGISPFTFTFWFV